MLAPPQRLRPAQFLSKRRPFGPRFWLRPQSRGTDGREVIAPLCTSLIGNCGYTQETAEQAIAGGHADLIAFGRPFLSNPDLVERFRNGWPLAGPAPMSDWSSPGAKGYTDYPAYAPARVAD